MPNNPAFALLLSPTAVVRGGYECENEEVCPQLVYLSVDKPALSLFLQELNRVRLGVIWFVSFDEGSSIDSLSKR